VEENQPMAVWSMHKGVYRKTLTPVGSLEEGSPVAAGVSLERKGERPMRGVLDRER